jgi:hypothetical protein
MKCQLPPHVIFLNCSAPNSGLFRSVNYLAAWATTKFHFTARTLVETNALEDLEPKWGRA